MPSSIERSLTVAAPLPAVAAYLCDLTHSAEWDEHTLSCRRLDEGPLAVGARYEQKRSFARWTITFTVEVVEYRENESVAWRSTTRFGRGLERFAFSSDDDGRTRVDHEVEVQLLGPARLGQRNVPDIMRRIAADSTPVLREKLERLG